LYACLESAALLYFVLRSKTLATTVALVDRALGLTALILVTSFGAFAASLTGIHGGGCGSSLPAVWC